MLVRQTRSAVLKNLQAMFATRTILAISILFLASCSDLGKVDDRVHLEWNYDYSSDVVHALLISNNVSVTNSDGCRVNYSVFEVIESFKGKFERGDRFKASGIQIHEVTTEDSQQFLFLKPLVTEDYPGFGDCLDEDYSDYLIIHNWCCSIDLTGSHSLILYDMLNSETSGERYLVPTEPVFQKMRQLKAKIDS